MPSIRFQPADTRSGTAPASAWKMASECGPASVLPNAVAAGKSAFRIVPRGGVEQVGQVRLDARGAVTAVQLDDAALAHHRAADLCADVLLDDRQANVGEDHAPHVAAQRAALDHAQRRDAQRLLPYLRR